MVRQKARPSAYPSDSAVQTRTRVGTPRVRSGSSMRANPANVPLDLYAPDDPDPYPYPFEDESLAPEEKSRRWEAISKHRYEQQKTAGSRRRKASEEYDGIFANVVRGIDERMSSLDRAGLFRDGSMTGAEWIKLGDGLASVVRDMFAADLLLDMRAVPVDGFGYAKAVDVSHWKSGRHRGPVSRLRDEMEARALLYGQIIRAGAAFRARDDVASWHATRGSPRDRAQTIASAARAAAVRMQADIARGRYDDAKMDLYDLFSRISQILSVDGLVPDRVLLANFASWPITSLRARAREAEQLAKKGVKMSRKSALAEEARLARLEKDRPRANPFAGYKDFAACVRDKSKDPKVYSSGGVCATIERRSATKHGRRNPVAEIVQTHALGGGKYALEYVDADDQYKYGSEWYTHGVRLVLHGKDRGSFTAARTTFVRRGAYWYWSKVSRAKGVAGHFDLRAGTWSVPDAQDRRMDDHLRASIGGMLAYVGRERVERRR